MIVHLKLFAVARELAGRDMLELELPSPATIGQLRQALAAHSPALARIAQHVMFAIGTNYADDGATIVEPAEIACIPPVSGG
jgi:molybdopterin synthase sulfur carrier subunit